ncbi:unnamed protein product [Arabis nemorensis]|uniref:Zinc finger C2H2 LYAR-type domain-containing protein n=1 Tax=Arabis nemorensis TaxID=586526 RepID=A0A565BEL6_9BRAS|nr:unnamed protein product [Arabis nemorensis]
MILLLLPLRFCGFKQLSCIDCGNMFGRDSVQWHNQCLTEAEKYGPKRPSSGTPSNPKENSKQQINFDINVALSNRPSWICRYSHLWPSFHFL